MGSKFFFGNKRSLRVALCAGALAIAGCIDPPGPSLEDNAYRAFRKEALYARSSVLWPVSNGQATVRVCWLPLEGAANRFPDSGVAPDLNEALPRLKGWAREIVEQEWNDSTPLNFVGWEDCDGSAVDVHIRPISSAYTAPCGSRGQPCVEALGKDIGRDQSALYLNLLFGEEVRYSSRGGQWLNPDYWWLPQACMIELKYPLEEWQVNDPSFDETYKSCLQFNVLHEFGHVAGFAHEQYRTDDAEKQAECNRYIKSIGMEDDLSWVEERYKGTTPLGPFDSESIMSYCRTDPSPSLTEQDIEMTYAAYGVDPDENPAAGTGGAGGAAGSSTGTGGAGGAAGASTGTGGSGGADSGATGGPTGRGGMSGQSAGVAGGSVHEGGIGGDGSTNPLGSQLSLPPTADLSSGDRDQGGCSVMRWRPGHEAPTPPVPVSVLLGLAFALAARTGRAAGKRR